MSVRLMIRVSPQLVICSGKGPIWMLPILSLFAKRSHLSAFVHGSELTLPSRVAAAYTVFALRYSRVIFCVSKFTADLLPESHSGAVRIIPNGLWLPDFPIRRPEGLTEIQSKGSPRLLTVGRISVRKGQFRVVKAMPELLKKWPLLHYHVVGIDKEGWRLMDLARELGVDRHVTIHGELTSRYELFQAYCSCDVFVMLSQRDSNGDVEGFGIAILEANYFGLPAIGAKYCGIEEAIENGLNGYLVDGNNTSEISTAIELCLKRGKPLAEAIYSWVNKHDWSVLISDLMSDEPASGNLTY